MKILWIFFLVITKLDYILRSFLCILREKSLAIYFWDSQFRRNRTFNLKVSKIYDDKRTISLPD